jgi:phospholipase C
MLGIGGSEPLRKLKFLFGVSIAVVAGCVQQTGARSIPQGVTPADSQAGVFQSSASLRNAVSPLLLGNGKITHVVIIFQENRSVDNLFRGLPGADTVNSGPNSAGQQVTLQPEPLAAPFDIDHEHAAFETAYDNGKLDGFNLERSTCRAGRKNCPQKFDRPYSYVPRKEVQPYFTMAEQYAFADRMFQTNSGPSFPAHQYILSGTSTISEGSSLRASENPITAKQNFTGGCDSPAGTLVMLIDAKGSESREAYPCFDRPALTDLIDAKHLSWHYYQSGPGSGLWNGPDAIKHIHDSSQFATDVVYPPRQILKDISMGNLATVAWVTPTYAASDHAGNTNGTGPAWVASVVNRIGKSKYWNNTAIFIAWDDWGGWYDHVKPPQFNSYELGFRVPLIVISPYTPKGFMSHKQHEFGSILKFTEQALGLGSLGTTDVRADNLSDCFNFSQKPRPFQKIAAPLSESYFLNEPISTQPPDDDY